MKTTKSPNRLSAKSSYGLVTWIQRNLEQIQREGLGDKQVAERAGAALGFEVLPSNVRALRGQFGWKWGRASAQCSGAAALATKQDLADLTAIIDDLLDMLPQGVFEGDLLPLRRRLAAIGASLPPPQITTNGHTDNQPLFQS